MAESPAVALLFEDVALGEQLRHALVERGARIVHEGALGSLGPQQLLAVDADVLVVNLETDDDEALDRLYGLIEGARPRVVFNDAQASRKLEGWDRARWARHLAMKALAMGEVDPPRPEDAREIEVHAAALAEVAVPLVIAVVAEDPAHQRTVAASETLAAELEALLAAEQPADEADESAREIEFDAGSDAAVADDLAPAADSDADASIADVPSPPSWLSLMDDVAASQLPATSAEPVGPPLTATARQSDSWSLAEDVSITPAPSTGQTAASAFGIQVQEAVDYLAPDADTDHAVSPIVPGLSLEVMSIEEAIAPQRYEAAHEMMLDELAVGLGRLVLLGATTEGTTSVCQFLACLPADLAVTVLHTQHQAGKPTDALVEHLTESCRLPVRLAVSGMRARKGEVLVVPTDQQVRLRRDGTVELEPIGERPRHAPSIDISFTMAASEFGGDALAIVFAGRSTDAVGGCQAIHDRGGQIWAETPIAEHGADMVSGVLAERLTHYSGTPQQLAIRLVEELRWNPGHE